MKFVRRITAPSQAGSLSHAMSMDWKSLTRQTSSRLRNVSFGKTSITTKCSVFKFTIQSECVHKHSQSPTGNYTTFVTFYFNVQTLKHGAISRSNFCSAISSLFLFFPGCSPFTSRHSMHTKRHILFFFFTTNIKILRYITHFTLPMKFFKQNP